MAEPGSATETKTAEPATNDAAGEIGDISDIAASLASGMPDVQEHAVAQAAADAQRIASETPKDNTGAPFDPAQHAANAEGKGVLTTGGTWAKKRGRKASAAGTVPVSTLAAPRPTGQAIATVDAAAHQAAQSRAAGVAAAEMLIMLGVISGGDEWHPRKEDKIGLDERGMLHSAFGDYFVATNKTDIPPGAALAFCILAYAAPRFTMPKTQSRLTRAKASIAAWWIRRKDKRREPDAQVAAPATKRE